MDDLTMMSNAAGEQSTARSTAAICCVLVGSILWTRFTRLKQLLNETGAVGAKHALA